MEAVRPLAGRWAAGVVLGVAVALLAGAAQAQYYDYPTHHVQRHRRHALHRRHNHPAKLEAQRPLAPAQAQLALTPPAQAPTPALARPPPRAAAAFTAACNPPPTREDAAYCEARTAAAAATQSAKWAPWQLALSGLGLAGLLAIVWFTRNAAKAAANAARIAERMLLDLERPYLFVHGIHGVEALADDGYRPRIVYSVSNNGKLAARIENVAIRCGTDARETFPPLVTQTDHCLLMRPVLASDEERSRITYDLSGEDFIFRAGADRSARGKYELEDGVIFQVAIAYRSPAGKPHETVQCWRYQNDLNEWTEVVDRHYTYMS